MALQALDLVTFGFHCQLLGQPCSLLTGLTPYSRTNGFHDAASYRLGLDPLAMCAQHCMRASLMSSHSAVNAIGIAMGDESGTHFFYQNLVKNQIMESPQNNLYFLTAGDVAQVR
jgi:hypothetical protein